MKVCLSLDFAQKFQKISKVTSTYLPAYLPIYLPTCDKQVIMKKKKKQIQTKCFEEEKKMLEKIGDSVRRKILPQNIFVTKQ